MGIISNSSPSFSGIGGGRIAGTTSGIGGAVSDLFAGQGDLAEATNYDLASQYATTEAQFTKSATNISREQANRQLTQAIGSEKAGYAGGGLTLGGSAGDVLRSSAQQGALTKATINYQASETALGFTEQAQSYSNLADAARSAASGANIGAVLQGLGAVANIATLAP